MSDALYIALFIIVIHGITMACLYAVARLRAHTLNLAIIHRNHRVKRDIAELVVLLQTAGLETPERHYILKAYLPNRSLWLDDIHPPPLETPANQ